MGVGVGRASYFSERKETVWDRWEENGMTGDGKTKGRVWVERHETFEASSLLVPLSNCSIRTFQKCSRFQ